MRPPAHSPVPPLLLLLSCPRGIYRCVQLLLLLLLLLIVSGGTARAGRGRRPTSVSPDLLPPWLVREQVSNMSREFHDSWGTCGHRREQQEPQACEGHVHLRHHGRGHCGSQRSDHLAQRVCHHGSGRARRQHLRKLRAPNCGPWTNTSHWGREVAESSEKCFRTMRHLLHMDDLAGAAACRYSHILARYDCRGASSFLGARLSPHHSMCDLCQEAYRYWVCSQLFPYYNHNGERVKPCRSFCHEVEQKCPYFLPKYKPVAGEPTFLCQDPDIGELPEQESSYGGNSCCYYTCSVGAAMGHLLEFHDHTPLPTICTTCDSSPPTTTTASSTTTSATAVSSAGGSMSPSAPDSSEANLKCLSTKDSCLLHSGPGPAPPLSSSGCPFVLRKHCWTPKALYILLLFLVRTDFWLPRGFT